MEYFIIWCLENGIEIFDFTVGEDAYKKDCCNQEMKLYEYRESKSFKGTCYIFIHWLKEIKRKNKVINLLYLITIKIIKKYILKKRVLLNFIGI